MHSMVLRSRKVQTFRTVWFGSQRRFNLTHNMVLRPSGAQTLRTVWFGDLKAPKLYAQYGLEKQRLPNLTHSMILLAVIIVLSGKNERCTLQQWLLDLQIRPLRVRELCRMRSDPRG